MAKNKIYSLSFKAKLYLEIIFTRAFVVWICNEMRILDTTSCIVCISM